MVVIVEEPAVNFAGAELGLNGSDVGHVQFSWRRPAMFLRCLELLAFGCGTQRTRTCPTDTPATLTRFVRLFSPVTILTAAMGTFKRSARKRRSALFARSSTGGAVKRIFSAPAYSPSMALQLARGTTRTANITAPSRVTTSITALARAPRISRCRGGFQWRLLQWRSRSRGSCPLTKRGTCGRGGGWCRRATRGACGNRGADAPGRRRMAGLSSGQAGRYEQRERRLRRGTADPFRRRRFWSIRRPGELR